MTAPLSWDIFCRVIDNLGDIGVTWRLARDLAMRGDTVRLWLDDPAPLAWMAPHQLPDHLPDHLPHSAPGVQVCRWDSAATAQARPAAVVVEAFGCELDDGFKAAMAATAAHTTPPVWINLEYLSAEPWVRRAHGLPSPQTTGPAAGLPKWFFFPGFEAGTGGLLREPDLPRRQQAFDAGAWLAAHGVSLQPGELAVSLFCYEPPALAQLLDQLARPLADGRRARLLLTHGRAQQAVDALAHPAGLRLHRLGALSQQDYDHLLWSCDLNLVRGEDSAVRALWAGRPFVWQLYPQDDGAHAQKLEAFLRLAEPGPADAPGSAAWHHWAGFHRAWNGLAAGLPAIAPGLWAPVCQALAGRLAARPDLAGALRDFAAARLGGGG